MKDLKDLDLKQKKYIIFDMDGTLIDSIGMWNMIDVELLRIFGCQKVVDKENLQQEKDDFLSKNNTGDLYLEYGNFLIERYKLNTTKEELLEARWQISNYFLESIVGFKNNVVTLIKILKSRGYKLVLATVGTKQQINIYATKNKKMTNLLNIYDYFDLILTKEDVEKKKPDPEIYLKTLKFLNANPNECLVFEDSLHGVLSAKNANIEVVNVYDEYANKDREDLNKLADYQINNYSEFINYIINYNDLPKVKKYILKDN